MRRLNKADVERMDEANKGWFKEMFLKMMGNKENPYHPLVWINGDPKIGKNVYIGGFSEVNAKGAEVYIGYNCDIASFVSINVADSHLKVLGFFDKAVCKDIWIGNNVFIGSHCAILGGTIIQHHCVIGAGSVVRGETIPPYSLAYGNPLKIAAGYYQLMNDPVEQNYGEDDKDE